MARGLCFRGGRDSHTCPDRIIGASIEAIATRASLSAAMTSPRQTAIVRPDRMTRPSATNRGPWAGARKLILYSTVRTSAPADSSVSAAYPRGVVRDRRDDAAVDVTVLLRQGVAKGELDVDLAGGDACENRADRFHDGLATEPGADAGLEVRVFRLEGGHCLSH